MFYAERCPKCDGGPIIDGYFRGLDMGTNVFIPAGMKFFELILWANGVPCSGGPQACLECGHVWLDLNPETLRAYVAKHGKAEAVDKLAPFRKPPPADELA